MLEFDGDPQEFEEAYMATFQVSFSDVFGTVHMHDLKEGGESIPVTKENRQVGGGMKEEGAEEGEMDIQCRGGIMRAGHYSSVVRALANLRATGPFGFHEPAHSPPIGLITHVFSWEWLRRGR